MARSDVHHTTLVSWRATPAPRHCKHLAGSWLPWTFWGYGWACGIECPGAGARPFTDGEHGSSGSKQLKERESERGNFRTADPRAGSGTKEQPVRKGWDIGGQRTPCQRANWHDSAVERRGLSDVCHLEAVRWWSPSAIGNCAVRGRRSV
jgi:hypothetical protein